MRNEKMREKPNKIAELQGQLEIIESEIRGLRNVQAPKKEFLQDSRLIDKEIKESGKCKRTKADYDQLINEAYKRLKAGNVTEASEIYDKLERMYQELVKTPRKT